MSERGSTQAVFLGIAIALVAVVPEHLGASGTLPTGQPDALRCELTRALDLFDRGGRWKESKCLAPVQATSRKWASDSGGRPRLPLRWRDRLCDRTLVQRRAS